jgi:coenzyme F420 hydrogenase subunit delta
MVPDWRGKRTCILGCGNPLFGDDGFGPAVAQYCEGNCAIPNDACVVDAGTSVRTILLDMLLSDERPARIALIDAMDCGREPGDLFQPDIDSLPRQKSDDFSVHQTPSSNMLRELRDQCGVEISVLACQVGSIPQEVSPGLSDSVSGAVVRAAEILAREYFG